MKRILLVAVAAMISAPAWADCPQDVDAQKANIAVLQQQLANQQAAAAPAVDTCRTETQLIEQMKKLGGIYQVCMGQLSLNSTDINGFKQQITQVDNPHKTRCGA